MATSPLVENGFYLGARSDEVRRTLLQRWILGRPVCFYRLQNGSITAIEDRCPHRRYPLSLGRLDGDVIEYNDHGYRIDAGGGCVAEQPDTPKASVHRYPLVERDGVAGIRGRRLLEKMAAKEAAAAGNAPVPRRPRAAVAGS